jgi:hypothetical protein
VLTEMRARELAMDVRLVAVGIVLWLQASHRGDQVAPCSSVTGCWPLWEASVVQPTTKGGNMSMRSTCPLVLVLLLAVVVAGCDPTTGMPGQKATLGGLGGAAAGGLLGAAAGTAGQGSRRGSCSGGCSAASWVIGWMRRIGRRRSRRRGGLWRRPRRGGVWPGQTPTAGMRGR